MIPESRFKWLRVDTQVRKTYPFSIDSSELVLQDEYINLDDITKLTDVDPFKLNEIPTKSYEADSLTLMDITFERNLDLLVIARAGYTVLDLISDIGGILGILMSAAGTFLFAWGYNSFDNYMVTKLYRVADNQ